MHPMHSEPPKRQDFVFVVCISPERECNIPHERQETTPEPRSSQVLVIKRDHSTRKTFRRLI